MHGVRPRLLLAITTILALQCQVVAQPPQPPPPEKYKVTLRYRIIAPRDQHVAQYDALIEHLKSLDFDFDPPLVKHPATDREDPSKNTLQGLVASEKALEILRNPSVASLLLVPDSFKLPDDLEQSVRVRLDLTGGLPLDRQRDLSEQVRAVLDHFKFREAVGYDHRGYSRRQFTRIVGTIPNGRLADLLKDLRGQPAGWFAPRIPAEEVPAPLRTLNPIQVIEVLPDQEPITDVSEAAPRSPEYLEKIESRLWAIVNQKGKEGDTIRVEVVFNGDTADGAAFRDLLLSKAPGLFVEGQVGQVATCLLHVDQVRDIAAIGDVSAVRLPRAAHVNIDPALKVSPGGQDDKAETYAARALDLSGLGALHKKGHRGKGVRLAIIDTDFRGWEALVKQGKLSARTKLVDLTAERSLELIPAAWESDPKGLGHGTQCALAAALAAPEAELVLVRIEAASPYEIDEVMRYFRGGALSSYLDRRRDDLAARRSQIDFLRSEVLAERRLILEDFTDETDVERAFGFLGPVYGWVFSDRAWSRDRVAYVEKLEEELRDRARRYFALTEEIRKLKGIYLAACPLVWNEGYPMGGASPLSRSFDRGLKSPPLWFQSAGNSRGQSWSGLLRDGNGNGILEFAPADGPLPKGRWTSELNFLGWQAWVGDRSAVLPEKARVRISLQWREPHDPDYFARAGEEDLYRKPLADLRLTLLAQRDPEAKTLPADAFNVIARSQGLPQRLENVPTGAIYEVTLEAEIPAEGRYAIRVERPVGFQWFLVDDAAKGRPAFTQLQGLQPTGIRPLGVPTLPDLEKKGELQTRLFVDAVGPERLKGRPILVDFTTAMGSVGSPGDARSVITVGAADFDGVARPWSATGAVAFAELSKKPTLLAFDALGVAPHGKGGAFGASLSTAFAAGTAAALLSGGYDRESLRTTLRNLDGKLLRVRAK